MAKTRSRSWCFTVNNPTTEVIEKIKGLGDYLILGKETAPTTGTEHIQGYVYFKNAVRFSTLKAAMPKAHIEVAHGTPEENTRYCSKENVFFTKGEIPQHGKRNDIMHLQEIIKTHPMPMRKIIEDGLGYQCIRHAEKVLPYIEPERNWKPEVIWITGPTGSGKTKLARELCTNPYQKSGSHKWWAGYDAHEHVIIDDFRGSSMPFTEALQLLDRYPCRIEYKGGERQFLAKKIVITSIMRPELCYPNLATDPIAQLLRRIDQVIDLTQKCDTEVAGNTKPLLKTESSSTASTLTKHEDQTQLKYLCSQSEDSTLPKSDTDHQASTEYSKWDMKQYLAKPAAQDLKYLHEDQYACSVSDTLEDPHMLYEDQHNYQHTNSSDETCPDALYQKSLISDHSQENWLLSLLYYSSTEENSHMAYSNAKHANPISEKYQTFAEQEHSSQDLLDLLLADTTD